MSEIEYAHAATGNLVLVSRPNTSPRRPNGLARLTLCVHELVIRKHEMRAIADVQPPFDIDAIADETVDLGEERIGVEHHTVTDRAAHAGVKDAARNLVEHEGRVAGVNGMPGVGTALVADHPVRALGEDVDQLSLPFVAPLRANDDERTCLCAEHA